ncbi:MAG: MATE family efflux transporter [Oscillospiraceae bacterium]|nr:MATE family efflux transporter [Oscillospiraceae bacterium]
MHNKKEVSRQIYRMLIPMILENVLTTSASLVTTAMVGRLTALEISAQGVGGRITNTYLSLFKGLAIGVTVVAALYFGEGRRDKCRRTVEQAFATAVPLGLVITGLVAAFPTWFIKLFTSDADILSYAVGYLRILSFSLPFVAISCFVTAAFQSQGNTKTPMVIAGIVNVVNIALGWLLIFGNMGLPAMGLTGAGIALVSAQIAGAAIGLLLLYHKRIGLFLGSEHGKKFFSLESGYLKEIYTTGLPASCENLLWQFATIIISRVILSYGTNSYAAYQLGLQAEGVCDMLSVGFITASTTLAARAIGQRDDQLYKMYFKQLIRISMAISIFTCAVLFFCPRLLMSLLTDKQELIEIGMKYVFIMGFAQIPQNLSKILNGTIRSAGHKYMPMVISFTGIWLVRVVLCCLSGWVFHWDIVALWWAIALDQLVRIAFSAVFFWKKRVYNTVQTLPPLHEKEPAQL